MDWKYFPATSLICRPATTASSTFFSATASATDGGRAPLEKLFLLFRGLPFQSITPEIYNLRHQAINFVSMYRWDAEKRRVLARLSSPFQANPKFRYAWTADLRSENWDIRNSFQGPAPVLESFNMRREAVGVDFAAFESGRWQWSAGAEVSHRDFRSVSAGTALTPSLLTKGYQLKQIAQVKRRALAIAGAAIDPRGWRVVTAGAHLVATLPLVREAAGLTPAALVSAIAGRRL